MLTEPCDVYLNTQDINPQPVFEIDTHVKSQHLQGNYQLKRGPEHHNLNRTSCNLLTFAKAQPIPSSPSFTRLHLTPLGGHL